MTLWVNAQPPPQLCDWLLTAAGIEAVHVRDLGLLGAEDPEIFEAAREADAVVITEDRDFIELLHRRGTPPHPTDLAVHFTHRDEEIGLTCSANTLSH